MPANTIITLRKGSFSEWNSTDPILASGEPGFDLTNNILKIGDGTNNWLSLNPLSSDLHVYVKNITGNNLTKGQAVYINGAQGDNPTIQLAIASGESTSSKTLGLLKQDLDNNEFGYVISEGILEGIDTNEASAAGDSMWLSPSVSGGIVYGTSNKPYAPNHMVFLGYVLRKNQNNGKAYIKIQNGFELQELHNVAISGVSDGQFLQYNSASGLWLASSSGNFTSLNVNGTGVSVSGHTHTSSNITDFNSSVSGLLPTISNSGDNRILTSTGGSVGINAESNLTFDGSVLNIDGNLVFDSFTESVVAIGNSSTSKTISIGSGTVQTCTLTGNCIFTMPSLVAGKSFTMFLNTGAGSFTASFSGVLWAGGTAPTITTTASKVDILSFISDGTYWYGSYSQNY